VQSLKPARVPCKLNLKNGYIIDISFPLQLFKFWERKKLHSSGPFLRLGEGTVEHYCDNVFTLR